ncbi:MAG TPA: hypothetical protein VFH61_18260 [Thermoleophilia bacterium]|nr:hypothetical protein [Thermoleophilia bacterium]
MRLLQFRIGRTTVIHLSETAKRIGITRQAHVQQTILAALDRGLPSSVKIRYLRDAMNNRQLEQVPLDDDDMVRVEKAAAAEGIPVSRWALFAVSTVD